ncbi:hypothetical protein Fmac_001084 [Flemingia macrophylla]|uniref:Uncharacterized protein n=1 Tax=Flemingia macrophylla TaxID=520843 RepID=A0ABD1NG55_9FABA
MTLLFCCGARKRLRAYLFEGLPLSMMVLTRSQEHSQKGRREKEMLRKLRSGAELAKTLLLSQSNKQQLQRVEESDKSHIVVKVNSENDSKVLTRDSPPPPPKATVTTAAPIVASAVTATMVCSGLQM